MIAQAQSGTGKTATFTIGALASLQLQDKSTQVLILSPTRELSKQSTDVVSGIGSMMKGLVVKNLVGGSSIDEDSDNLKNNVPHVICGCPGRVYDMLRRQQIHSKKIKLFILDEADELLTTGFKEQVYNIFQFLPSDVQVVLFSATLPPYINTITSKFMRDPVRISVKAEQLTLEGISQYYVAIDDDRHKYATLKDLYQVISMSQCIIYCNNCQASR